jgi:proline iminopeptidase
MEYFITIGTTKIWTNINNNQHCTKPYLCMCGGGPGVSDGLSEVDPLLNVRYNTIRFDPRGCGRSTEDGKYDIETAIDDIEAIRQFYNIESWYILGHSWGADIALFYTLKYPQYCRSVIHLCGLGVQNDIDWSEECAKNNEYEPEETPETSNYPMNYDVLDKALHSYWKYIQSPMLLKNISMLQVPFLIICAEKDPRPAWPNIQLSNLLPVAKLIILERCGHFPWLSNPDLLCKTIFDWFGAL